MENLTFNTESFILFTTVNLIIIYTSVLLYDLIARLLYKLKEGLLLICRNSYISSFRLGLIYGSKHNMFKQKKKSDFFR